MNPSFQYIIIVVNDTVYLVYFNRTSLECGTYWMDTKFMPIHTFKWSEKTVGK